MMYAIMIKDPREGHKWIFDSILPGLFAPEIIEMTSASFAEEMELCNDCPGNFCHVIEQPSGRKYCPMLFADVVKPGWNVEDVI